nr:MAG TPA: hypothetical protein [Caudoviricetes sp.]
MFRQNLKPFLEQEKNKCLGYRKGLSKKSDSPFCYCLFR